MAQVHLRELGLMRLRLFSVRSPSHTASTLIGQRHTRPYSGALIGALMGPVSCVSCVSG